MLMIEAELLAKVGECDRVSVSYIRLVEGTPMQISAACCQCVRAIAIAIMVGGVVGGCRASMAPDAGFVPEPALLHPDASLPFDAVWLQEGTDLRSYKKVYVAPIDTTHLLKLDWWDRANIAPGDQNQQAAQLAGYFRDSTIAAFKNDTSGGFQVVDAADQDTLVVELAIVEVVPTKVWLNALGYVVAGALSQGTTAFEGRFRDGRTQRVVAEFKDREFGQLDLVSVNDLSWYGHSKHTLRTWSDDLVEMSKRVPTQAIAPMSTVTLKPW